MVDTNKVQEAMQEVDRQFDGVAGQVRPTVVPARRPGSEPANLIAWLRMIQERQEDLGRKVDRILNFLGATEK
jgi:hypothetical protein